MLISVIIMLVLVVYAAASRKTNTTSTVGEIIATQSDSTVSIDLEDLTAGAGNSATVNSFEAESTEPAEDTNGDMCISLETAAALGLNEAAKYYSDMKLVDVYSYPDDIYPDIDGEDGKRCWWYVDCANSQNNFVSVLIYNSTILNVEQWDNRENDGTFDLTDIYISFDEAISRTQSYGITGGNAKSSEIAGYNFSLGYQNLDDENDEKTLVLTISGTNRETKKVARVNFNAKTGEVISHEELQSTNAYKKNSWTTKN